MKLWDCLAVECPGCGIVAGQRCKPLGPPYKARSKRAEVDAPHVTRLNKWRNFNRYKEEK